MKYLYVYNWYMIGEYPRIFNGWVSLYNGAITYPNGNSITIYLYSTYAVYYSNAIKAPEQKLI